MDDDGRGGAAASVRSALRSTRDALAKSPQGKVMLERAARKRWAGRLVSAGLVDKEFIEAQVGLTFKHPGQAAEFVLSSRSDLGYAPHPLIEPVWIERDLRVRRMLTIPHWCSTLFSGPLVSTSPLFNAAAWSELRPGVHLASMAAALRDFLDSGPDTSLPIDSAYREEVGSLGGMTFAAARASSLERARAYGEQNARTQWRPTKSWDFDQEAKRMAAIDRRSLMEAGHRPLVSVIMPTYNRAQVILGAIESVRRQSYASWELLVVDDGSTDDSSSVVRRIAAVEPRIRLVEQPNGGVSSARNRGIDEARGDLIAFLDSDNEWTPKFLARMVSALSESGAIGGYSAIEAQVDDGSMEYLGRPGTRADLIDGRNFIDMNGLVVDAEAIRRIGGFESSLRRWVDYDLVLRLLTLGRLEYVPFIGVHYDHRSSGAARITTSEPSAWRNVVLERALVDWDDVQTASQARVDDRVSILTHNARGGWLHNALAITSILREADGIDLDVEVVLIDGGSPRHESSLLADLFAGDERVVVKRTARNLGIAAAANIGFALSSGEFVLILDSGASIPATSVVDLRDEAKRTPGVVHSAATLHSDGSVHNAGWIFPGGKLMPHRFLDGFGGDELETASAHRSRAANGAAALLEARRFADVRGMNPIFGRDMAGIDLGIKVAAGQEENPTFSRVRVRLSTPPSDLPDFTIEESRLASSIIGSHLTRPSVNPYPAHDLDVAGWAINHQRPAGTKVGHRGVWAPMQQAAPLFVRSPEGGKRWAIKIASPAAPRGDSWGDTYFAAELARALKKRGQKVVVDRIEAHYRRARAVDDVVLTIRGLASVAPQPGAVNVLWVISHPELVSDEEIRAFDIVFAASELWAEAAAARTGVRVLPLLQATDPTIFHPEVGDPGTGHELLFVGVPRKAMRPIVQHAIDAGRRPALYGSGWEGYVDADLIQAHSLPRDEVARHYRTAGAVLSDHWDEMAAQGFLANRLFDAAAAGAAILTDHVIGIEKVFGDVVRVISGPEDIDQALEGDVGLPTEAERMELSRRIRAEHSFDTRAQQLVDAVDAEIRRRSAEWS